MIEITPKTDRLKIQPTSPPINIVFLPNLLVNSPHKNEKAINTAPLTIVSTLAEALSLLVEDKKIVYE